MRKLLIFLLFFFFAFLFFFAFNTNSAFALITPCSDPAGCGKGCPVCVSPDYYNPYNGQCANTKAIISGNGLPYSPPTYETCGPGYICSPGCGCNCTLPKGFEKGALPCGPDGKTCDTAFGRINIDPQSLVKKLFGIVLSIAGGIAVILIIISGYRLISSQGNPERIKDAQEQLTAAIIGLLFVIFAFSILRFIGVDLLNIFSQ